MNKELLQQALDALVAMQMEAAARHCGLKITDDAIDALGAVIAQPEQLEGDAKDANWKAEFERMQLLFQAETLRASNINNVLQKFVAHHKIEHEPGAWSRSCYLCSCVGEARALERTIEAFVREVEALHGITATPQGNQS